METFILLERSEIISSWNHAKEYGQTIFVI